MKKNFFKRGMAGLLSLVMCLTALVGIGTTTAYGTGRINAYKIIEETLNLKDVRIFDYVEDADGKKKAILNKKETAIAQAKQELIKQGLEESTGNILSGWFWGGSVFKYLKRNYWLMIRNFLLRKRSTKFVNSWLKTGDRFSRKNRF